MFKKIARLAAATALAGAAGLATVASAQAPYPPPRPPGYAPPPPPPPPGGREEFRHGEFREHHGHHRYGARCFHRISAEGYAHVDFYGGSGGDRKAQRRAIRHWSEQVSSRFGGHTGNWDNARGKEINCNRQGTELHCVASAHPCS